LATGGEGPGGVQVPWGGPPKGQLKAGRIDLAAEHDPVAVADGKVPELVTFGQADVSPEDAQKGLAVNKPWAVTGRALPVEVSFAMTSGASIRFQA